MPSCRKATTRGTWTSSPANQINRALRNAGVPAIWSTEWGWSAYRGRRELQDIIGVEGQADYVLRRLALMSALDYDRIFLFTLSDLDQRASVRDRDYGLLDLDANPKPVYLALQRFLKVTGPKLRPADPPVTENLPDGSFSIGWTREDGRNVWLFWSAAAAACAYRSSRRPPARSAQRQGHALERQRRPGSPGEVQPADAGLG